MAHLTATYIPSPAHSVFRKKSRGAKDGFAIFAVALSLVLLAVSFLDLANKKGSASEDVATTQAFGL